MFTHLDVNVQEALGLIDKVDAALYGEFTSAELQELADFALYRIQKRTKAGRDMNDKPFAAYDERTIKDRRKRGRATKRVTLSDTGRMMASMSSGVEGKRGIVFFTSANEGKKAHFIHNGTRKMPARKFMGLSRKDKRQMSEIAAAMVLKRINSI